MSYDIRIFLWQTIQNKFVVGSFFYGFTFSGPRRVGRHLSQRGRDPIKGGWKPVPSGTEASQAKPELRQGVHAQEQEHFPVWWSCHVDDTPVLSATSVEVLYW